MPCSGWTRHSRRTADDSKIIFREVTLKKYIWTLYTSGIDPPFLHPVLENLEVTFAGEGKKKRHFLKYFGTGLNSFYLVLETLYTCILELGLTMSKRKVIFFRMIFHSKRDYNKFEVNLCAQHDNIIKVGIIFLL